MQIEKRSNKANDILQTNGNGALYVTIDGQIAGEDIASDVMKVENRAGYTVISADTLVEGGLCRFWGYICLASDSGTLTVYDNTSANGTKLLDAKTLTAGDVVMFGVGIEMKIGMYVDIGGTSATVVLLTS